MKKIIKYFSWEKPAEFKYKIDNESGWNILYVSYTQNIFGKRNFERVERLVELQPPRLRYFEGTSADFENFENFMLTYNTLEKYLGYKNKTKLKYDRLTKIYEEERDEYKTKYNLL